MSNLVVHFEIHATEPAVLIDFYTELLGWRFDQFGDMQYWGVSTGEGAIAQTADGATPGFGINGGLTERRGPRPESGAPVNGSTLVIAVDDVDPVFARALELGGTEALAPDNMAGVGRLAYLQDPDGNIFGFIGPEK